ncbi:regulator of protease activity HflC (stomatin/prohibitin superfamily) [Cytobacillus eiseniae]|uniref:Regulator of protease activity HflC (Stomatin/prohibitin superfamily) n=1 Tax=Cytobacillus eiseniae TaxID=762947 RepID=A0ABS4RH87_9BACI|nr:SPFH domain-containing protein [Cytobacillus eiseniae]MBP2242251.1 regulator of protease activity HflC (stomatin/prohibitin superfamily) [Cytobacillus eiseniae]
MKDKNVFQVNGFVGILAIIVLIGLGVWLLMNELFFIAIPALIVAVLLASGITIVQPNQAAVVTFFGKYLGSIRNNGLYLTVPLSLRRNVSLRVRNFNSNRLKVNDVEGNPIEIAAVIVFKVVDSAKAVFDVDNYEEFVEIQSETAIRHVATKYPYDTFGEADLTLRGNAEEVSNELTADLQARLNVAGVEVIEARLTHLAYSTEIAQAMLQRQQATAIISARQKIVEGAVGMAQMAIKQLEADKTIELDDERKVQMVNNLLVAIVAEKPAQPVINTGTLY